MEQKTPIENNRKCYNCGKEFRTPTEYQRARQIYAELLLVYD
jgi:hypothetical protein